MFRFLSKALKQTLTFPHTQCNFNKIELFHKYSILKNISHKIEKLNFFLLYHHKLD